MKGTPYTCTEITLDGRVGIWDLRLWIGTPGLVSLEEARNIGQAALNRLSPAIGLESVEEVVDFARRNVERLNAIQVRFGLDGDWSATRVGMMAYTQPFEDNDEKRFGS